MRSQAYTNDPDMLDQLWQVMDSEKGDLKTRSEEYARWTIPSVCPPDNSEHMEQDKAYVDIGPRVVNHLANRIVDTMFPHERPFFAVTLTPEMRIELRKEMGKETEAQFAMAVREETAAVEEAAVRKLMLTAYRPQAVEAVKHMVITGNAVIRRLDDGKRVVYGIKDYCTRRTVDGKPYHTMLRDAKMFGNLPEDIQNYVRSQNSSGGQQYKDTDECVLYTEYKWDGGRWRMRQAVDSVVIDRRTAYRPVDVPILHLVWNLARGENYARGLVEDYATTFHTIDVLSEALIDMAGILADVKFLVDPASVLDPVELNNSTRGSYHQGREGDLSVPDFKRQLALADLDAIIKSKERELAQGFLLNSTAVRDAERVTAEEIRFIAAELESAFGGLYSRLALEWQKQEAEYGVSQINFDKDIGNSRLSAFEVVVTTGLESLSREGQLDNLRRALADLQLLDTVPEEIRATINEQKFASFVFTNHGVKHTEFLYTRDEMNANRDATMQQQQELLQMQANSNVAEEAGKQAIAQES